MHSRACMQPAAAVPVLEAQEQRPRRSERMQCPRVQTLSGLWALSLRQRRSAKCLHTVLTCGATLNHFEGESG